MSETRPCPNCGELATREQMGVCQIQCDEIVCPKCSGNHVQSYHNDPKNLEDEEWELVEKTKGENNKT